MFFRELSKETALNEMFKEEAEIETERKIKEQIESAWRQRKYELSNDFGGEFEFYSSFYDDLANYFDNEWEGVRDIEEENYFSKHLEYDLDRFGIPIIEPIKNYDKNDGFYKEVKVQEGLEEQEFSKLKEMLRERHHLGKNKRILLD